MSNAERVMIDKYGEKKVAAHLEVKSGFMRFADVRRKLVAEELGGRIATKGKRYLIMPDAQYRIGANRQSDNSTEKVSHDLAVETVYLDEKETGTGWLTGDELYARYGKVFDAEAMASRLVELL